MTGKPTVFLAVSASAAECEQVGDGAAVVGTGVPLRSNPTSRETSLPRCRTCC